MTATRDFDTSWADAERTCFERIRKTVDGEENLNCFIGYLPVQAPDVWSFTSGQGNESQIGRLWGSNPCFGTIRLKAMAECQYYDRAQAQKFGMQILRVLKETSNMNNVNNVQWLRVTDMPLDPVPIAGNTLQIVLWQVSVPLELVYATTTNYDA